MLISPIKNRTIVTATGSDATAGDLEELRRVLNDGGVLQHCALLEQIKNRMWDVYPDVSVSAMPFMYDPVLGIKKITVEPVVSSLLFQKAVADSQNESLRRDVVVDVVAANRDRVLCVGVENPRRPANWVFVGSSENGGFSALSKTDNGESKCNLMHVPKTDNNTGDLYMCVESCNPGPSPIAHNDKFSPRVYDQCRSFPVDAKDKCGSRDELISEASQQIVAGTYGLAVESLMRHVSSGIGSNRLFIPVIVTTANIFACEFDPGSSSPRFEERDAVIYDCPIPTCVKFPNQMADFEDREHMRRAVKWPVLVANREGLDRLLY